MHSKATVDSVSKGEVLIWRTLEIESFWIFKESLVMIAGGIYQRHLGTCWDGYPIYFGIFCGSPCF